MTEYLNNRERITKKSVSIIPPLLLLLPTNNNNDNDSSFKKEKFTQTEFDFNPEDYSHHNEETKKKKNIIEEYLNDLLLIKEEEEEERDLLSVKRMLQPMDILKPIPVYPSLSGCNSSPLSFSEKCMNPPLSSSSSINVNIQRIHEDESSSSSSDTTSSITTQLRQRLQVNNNNNNNCNGLFQRRTRRIISTTTTSTTSTTSTKNTLKKFNTFTSSNEIKSNWDILRVNEEEEDDEEEEEDVIPQSMPPVISSTSNSNKRMRLDSLFKKNSEIVVNTASNAAVASTVSLNTFNQTTTTTTTKKKPSTTTSSTTISYKNDLFLLEDLKFQRLLDLVYVGELRILSSGFNRNVLSLLIQTLQQKNEYYYDSTTTTTAIKLFESFQDLVSNTSTSCCRRRRFYYVQRDLKVLFDQSENKVVLVQCEDYIKKKLGTGDSGSSCSKVDGDLVVEYIKQQQLEQQLQQLNSTLNLRLIATCPFVGATVCKCKYKEGYVNDGQEYQISVESVDGAVLLNVKSILESLEQLSSSSASSTSGEDYTIYFKPLESSLTATAAAAATTFMPLKRIQFNSSSKYYKVLS